MSSLKIIGLAWAQCFENKKNECHKKYWFKKFDDSIGVQSSKSHSSVFGVNFYSPKFFLYLFSKLEDLTCLIF